MRPRSAPATYMNIEEQITLYPELTGEERAAVEAFVELHPEWKPALEEAKRLNALLESARSLGRDPTSDDALAYYVTTRRLQPEQAPEAVKDLLRQIEEHINRDPALEMRVAEMESRLRAIEDGSSAAEQFHALMERRRHHPPPSGSASRRTPAARRANSGWPEAARSSPAGGRNVVAEGDGWGGAPSPARRGGRTYLRRSVAAIIALAALYGALYIVGDVTRPTHERLAHFSDRELALEGYENVRGDDMAEELPAPTDAYLEALAHLRNAQTSFLGLFPTFDDARLHRAAALLNEVIRTEPEESFLATEAAFLLGKTELARGNVDAAEQALSRVIASGGRKAPEARRILEGLRS